MNAMPPLTWPEFAQLLAEHEEVIRLANELEYQLYRLGADQDNKHVTDCQQAGGVLIGHLRNLLFRHDQQVLPMLEASLAVVPGQDDRTERVGEKQAPRSGDRGDDQTR